MKTLLNLFFKKYFISFLKIYSICLITGIISVILVQNGYKFFTATMILSTFIPFGYSMVTHNEFQENLDWLINCHFNRKELIKYFFISQTSKVFLAFFSFTSIFFAMILTKIIITPHSPNKTSPNTALFNISWVDISFYHITLFYFVIIFAIYLFYFVSFFNSNKEEIRRKQISNSSKQLSLKEIWNNLSDAKKYGSILWFLCLFVFFKVRSDFILLCLLTFAVGFAGVFVFNRKFKLFNKRKEFVFGSALASILTIPLIFFFIVAISGIHDQNKTAQARLSNIIYVSTIKDIKAATLAKTYSELESRYDKKDILEIAANQEISPNYFTYNLSLKGLRDLNFIYSKYYKDSFNELVRINQNEINNRQYSPKEQLYLASSFMKVGLNKKEMLSLFEQGNVFTNFLVFNQARKALRYRQYYQFVKDNKEFLDTELKKINSIKRALASEKKNSSKKDKKSSKDEIEFNYSHF